MKTKIDAYSFNAGAKTITFSNYANINLDGILLITNVNSNVIIYNFADPAKGGTVAGNVITLDFNTTSMSNSDPLLIYYDDNDLIPVSYAMDRQYKMPLQVQLPQDLKQAQDGGLILADMAGPYIWNSQTINQPLIIDCTGYQSVLVHKTTTGVVTPNISNDGQNWAATLAVAAATTTPAATLLTAAGIYILPVISKYLKLTGPASAISCIIYLSQAPCEVNSSLNNIPFNLAQVAGSAPPTAGLAGTIVAGGPVAPGNAPTTNPLLIAGVDGLTAPLTRRALMDVLGRFQIGNTPSQNQKGINVLGWDPAVRNILEVQETSQTEFGENFISLLQQILIELKILNLITFQLPELLNKAIPAPDSPEIYRDQQTFN